MGLVEREKKRERERAMPVVAIEEKARQAFLPAHRTERMWTSQAEKTPRTKDTTTGGMEKRVCLCVYVCMCYIIADVYVIESIEIPALSP